MRKVSPNNYIGLPDIPVAHPYNLAAKSNEVLPAGLPIGSSIFVIDKVDAVFCDGEDNWYRQQDKPVPAGNLISALF